MYSKEGWGCPPFLSYILDLFFFRSQDCILPGICFDALCNEKWFWNTQHFWKIVKSRKMQTLQTEKQKAWNPKYKKKNQKQNKNTKHKPQNKQNCADTRFWLIYFAFFVFFPGESSYRMFFGDMMCFDCVVFCFSVFVEVKFLCWNRCHSSRSNERNRVCIQPNPAISNHIYPRSNHIYPRHVFSGWGSLSPPPFIHFDLSFSPDWNNLVYKAFLLLNCRKGHTIGIKWVIVWIQPDPTISKHA